MEAMATAYVLFEMLSPLMIKDLGVRGNVGASMTRVGFDGFLVVIFVVYPQTLVQLLRPPFLEGLGFWVWGLVRVKGLRD